MSTPHSLQRSSVRRGFSSLGVLAALLALLLIAGVVYFAREIAKAPSAPAAQTPVQPSSNQQMPAHTSNSTQPTAITSVDTTSLHSEAEALLRAGSFDQAATRLQKLIDSDHDDQGVRVLYAQAMLGLQRPVDAYEQYLAAIALAGPDASPKPSTSGSGAVRNPAAAQLHFEAGTCAVKAALPDRAIEHYQAAQLLDATEAKYPLYTGMVHAKAGDDAQAVAALIRAAKLNPDLAEAWGTLAEIELRRNNLGLAQQHIEKARAMQAASTRWRSVEARVHNRKGEPQKALDVLAGVSEVDRAQPTILAILGESLGLLKRTDDAASMYVKAADASPSDTELNYQAALWLDRAGKRAQAKKHAELAASLGHTGARSLLESLGKGAASGEAP